MPRCDHVGADGLPRLVHSSPPDRSSPLLPPLNILLSPLLLLLLFPFVCAISECCSDTDNDGWTDCDGDCDTTDGNIYPGAEELCDGVDTDCDGLDDEEDSDACAGFSGWSEPVTNVVEEASVTFLGDNGVGRLGRGSASAGDIDGDGRDEILIGEPGNVSGMAYLFWGKNLDGSNAFLPEDADITFTGIEGGDQLGRGMASVGDVDGDGLDDVLIGAPFDDEGGDGAGQVGLYLASTLNRRTNLTLADADYRFVASQVNGRAGFSVAGPGDVDGDGVGDILIGAYGNSEGADFGGSVYLVLSSSLGRPGMKSLDDADLIIVGEQEEQSIGRSVAGAGDVDGDGRSDLLIGASGDDQAGDYAGAAAVVLASSLSGMSTLSFSDADYLFTGEAASDYAGISVSAAGDLDADGFGDILIGAYGNDDGGGNAGRAYVILSSSLESLNGASLDQADYIFTGAASGDYAFLGERGNLNSTLGRSLAGGGDVNGDGLADIALGDLGNDINGQNAGAVFLMLTP